MGVILCVGSGVGYGAEITTELTRRAERPDPCKVGLEEFPKCGGARDIYLRNSLGVEEYCSTKLTWERIERAA